MALQVIIGGNMFSTIYSFETRAVQWIRGLAALAALAVLMFAMPASQAAAAVPNGEGTYEDLVLTFNDYWSWRTKLQAGVTQDFSPQAIAERRAELRGLHQRLDRLGVTGWTPSQRVDYLVVRAELDQHDFLLNVTKPWARDPVFYVAELLDIAFTPLPAKAGDLDTLRRQLRAIPAALEQAKINLDSVAADYADLAISYLTKSDGVENGYPYRAKPPAGVIGWYDNLLARAEQDQRALAADIRKARAAIVDFHAWMVANRSRMNAPAGVGEKQFDWFLRHGLLLPYTTREVELLCQRELDRLWAFYGLERFRNRGLPELERAQSAFEYGKRLASTDRLVRQWLKEKEFITIPPFIPVGLEEMGYNVPWIERETPPNFWEQVQFRDPVPDHLHAVIPGHRFDDHVRRNLTHPIRSKVRSHARWQGWAVYLEEGPLQAGILDDRARSRELIYVFGIWRAARSLGDVYGQRNDMRAQQVVDWWMEVTPLLDAAVARKYAHLRPIPGHGLDYTIGNIQMFQLLGDRKRQLGEKFVMKDFHDDLMSRGQIPVALLRYEMTGYEGDLKRFFERTDLQAAGLAGAGAAESASAGR